LSDIPDNIDLNWLGRRVLAPQDDTRALRADMAMLIRLAVRMDHPKNGSWKHENCITD